MAKLLYLVTEDWYFISHRLPMARSARAAGFDVHVATRVLAHGPAITSEGFILHELPWRRGVFAPLELLRMLRQVRALYRRVQPDVVHHVALQPAIVGSLASLGHSHRIVNAVTGLGFAFTSTSRRARALRMVITLLMRFLFNRPSTMVLVQNQDDFAMMAGLGIHRRRLALIRGSGVDTRHLVPMGEPAAPLAIAYVGRLLGAKGLRTIVAAHRMLRARGLPVRLLVAGEPDPPNRDSISEAEVDVWRRTDGVEILGRVADVRQVWAQAHIAVLASRREGLPLSLLEAAACGRPIVSTDVPGSREIARVGVNALLVPPDDAEALARAIEDLARTPALRAQLAAAGRQLVVREYSSEQIGADIVRLYWQVMGRRPSAA